MKHSLFAASLLALAVTAPVAQAFEAGDFVVRAGAVRVDPNVDSGNIKAAGTSIPGTKATVNDNTQFGLNFAYFVTDEVAIELLAATPFKHNIGIKGLGGGLDGKLGTTKHLPPTLSANYYPMSRHGSNFQPYIGIGVNYTNFFHSKLSSGAKQTFDGLSLKNSWGIAGQIGMDYMLSENVMLNAQVRYINIDTTAKTHTLQGDKVKVDVDIDPTVYMIGLGYKF